MHRHGLDDAGNNGETGARREAARSLVGNQASTATEHGDDFPLCCFETCGSEHQASFRLPVRGAYQISAER
jgi:hypothetical protein